MSAQPVHLLLGTTKGAFVVSSEDARRDWRVRGPFCDGWTINHAIGDPDSGMVWAGGGGEWTGAGIWRSGDGGHNWELVRLTTGTMDAWAADDPDFAQMIGWSETESPPMADAFQQIWSLGLANGRLLAGTKPARLLESADAGETWHEREALRNHPSADTWSPGGAGLVLHTIVADPSDSQALWVGISAAGVFATEDGGASWERRNRLSNTSSCGGHDHPAGPRDGETGHCVHNLVRAPGAAARLYQQNHHGVWRSSDGGRSWDDVTDGLPSTFGFPIRVHPRDPGTIWTLPLNGDMQGRFPPDAAAAVWRSRDAGETWDACRTGLPQEACFFTVLRQGMAVDTRDPAGVYFGTNSGSVFASADEGDTWSEIARHLPTILSVEVFEPA
ncbi:WD40/YVTN/BNR-like repeat-containing protein [Tranquillimonas rosea]|uniref:WD40/YVTN/BNR-like repeat-containing protein n=1 Tax=Tranquillimonas rosea TaxID=641238 RepID=UPI003BAA7EC2